MRILGEDSYWWKKEEKEWAAQDRSGNWWIYKQEEKQPPVKTYDKKRNGQTSNRFTTEHYIILALASALGISLALNIVALIS